MAWHWWMDPRYNKMFQDLCNENFKRSKLEADYNPSSVWGRSDTDNHELKPGELILFFIKTAGLIGTFFGTWALLEHFFPFP